jgi:hypothetical protein
MVLRVIGSEVGQSRLGGDLIALKMSEALFAQTIRAHLETVSPTDTALAAFADPNLSRALTAFHQEPAKAWSVESLTVFSAKMGTTPMQDLTTWRMQIACRDWQRRV